MRNSDFFNHETDYPELDGERAVEHLRQMLRFETTSYVDTSRIRYEEFDRMQAFLREAYPCVFSRGEVERIGYSLLGNGLFAFDKQCPNCLKEFNQANYPMDWDNSGMYVKCKKCGRRYNLNNSGFCVDDGKARKLIRYRASYDGNILSVHN